MIERERESERGTETEIDRDREREKIRERETEREKEKETEGQRQRDRDRRTDRQTETEREREGGGERERKRDIFSTWHSTQVQVYKTVWTRFRLGVDKTTGYAITCQGTGGTLDTHTMFGKHKSVLLGVVGLPPGVRLVPV